MIGTPHPIARRKVRIGTTDDLNSFFNHSLHFYLYVDRAYRIGQERNVKVFRLVARGTIEEQKYLRQVYKTQLKSETIVDLKNNDRRKSSRLFRGVAGDESRKGELFGCENLLKYKDGTFMNYASKALESQRYGVGVYDTNALLETVKDLSEDELNSIGQEGNVFADIAKSLQSDESDREDDVHLGGMSQAVMEVCEQVDGSDKNSSRDNALSIIHTTIPEETESQLISHCSGETQSPLYDALFIPPPEKTEHVASLIHDDQLTSTNGTICNVKKSSVRNTTIAGKTTDQIRRGEIGPTTFKVTDLFIPGRK